MNWHSYMDVCRTNNLELRRFCKCSISINKDHTWHNLKLFRDTKTCLFSVQRYTCLCVYIHIQLQTYIHVCTYMYMYIQSTHHSPCHVCWDLLLFQVTLSQSQDDHLYWHSGEQCFGPVMNSRAQMNNNVEV